VRHFPYPGCYPARAGGRCGCGGSWCGRGSMRWWSRLGSAPGSSPAVDHNLVVVAAQQDALAEAGRAAVSLVPDVVHFAGRGGLVAAAPQPAAQHGTPPNDGPRPSFWPAPDTMLVRRTAQRWLLLPPDPYGAAPTVHLAMPGVPRVPILRREVLDIGLVSEGVSQAVRPVVGVPARFHGDLGARVSSRR
jgi:hypothetical protein